MIRLVPLFLWLLLLVGCSSGGNVTENSEAGGDTIFMHYARNLQMVEFPGYTDVTIRNPWDSTQLLHRYCLVERSRQGKKKITAKRGEHVNVPLFKAAVFTSVHCALLQEMGAEQCIAGVCDLQFNHLDFIRQGVEDGRIMDLGNGMSPGIEQIMDLQPDALLISPFENSGGYGRLEQLGIPIIECADYMEVSPLARTEWIRFYGRLVGLGALADSLFCSIESRYLSLKQATSNVSNRPRLICELPQSGHWYMPGGGSTMGEMYKDAGANYVFQHFPGSGSVALSIEQVLDEGLTADIWLVKHHGDISRAQIIRDVPALKNIPAQIWLCDSERNGFYEETPFHPELLLENLIEILHPELGIKADKTYFSPI